MNNICQINIGDIVTEITTGGRWTVTGFVRDTPLVECTNGISHIFIHSKWLRRHGKE